jgi:DNA polymerase
MSSDRTPDETARKSAARILAWYEAMGVDAALEEQPLDWLARGDAAPGSGYAAKLAAQTPPIPAASSVPAAPSRPQAPPTPRAASAPPPQTARPARQFPPRPPAAPDGTGPSAPDNLAGAKSLAELGALLAAYDGCGLKTTAKNLCFYRGAERSPLMIIGEAPGREEDLEGKPFVGRAGQLLDKMLASIGMSEADVHITNIVYWRPPGNRTPTPQEALACRPFLERQLALVEPQVVLALGGAAAKHLLDVAEGIMRVRGKWRDLEMGGRTVKALATLHPAYLLRTPAAKGMAWRDLLAVKAALKAA